MGSLRTRHHPKENRAVAATRDLRTDWGLEASRSLFRPLEASQMQANRLPEITVRDR
jgi:hypothetical protein